MVWHGIGMVYPCFHWVEARQGVQRGWSRACAVTLSATLRALPVALLVNRWGHVLCSKMGCLQRSSLAYYMEMAS